jgi:hypothetical protein
MAVLQVKEHGAVKTYRVRSRAEALTQRDVVCANLKRQGYTIVGSCPGMTMLVCGEHQRALPLNADFCFIIATP